jgi:hypothetical protein
LGDAIIIFLNIHFVSLIVQNLDLHLGMELEQQQQQQQQIV